MRIISLLLAFTFSLNVFAVTGKAALEEAMNEYQYAITVDWDQKDQIFYEKVTNQFQMQVAQIYREQGISREDINAIISEKIKDKNMANSAMLKLSLLERATSAKDVQDLMNEYSKETYSKGASWSGEVVWTVAAISAVVIGFGVLLILTINGRGQKCSGTVLWQDGFGNACTPGSSSCFEFCY